MAPKWRSKISANAVGSLSERARQSASDERVHTLTVPEDGLFLSAARSSARPLLQRGSPKYEKRSPSPPARAPPAACARLRSRNPQQGFARDRSAPSPSCPARGSSPLARRARGVESALPVSGCGVPPSASHARRRGIPVAGRAAPRKTSRIAVASSSFVTPSVSSMTSSRRRRAGTALRARRRCRRSAQAARRRRSRPTGRPLPARAPPARVPQRHG